MKTFLIEIGTEEIPARFISIGLVALQEKFEEFLNNSFIEYGKITGYATPRRLTLLIEDVSEKQQDREVEIIGPPKKAAFDSAGSPTKAALGFAGSLKVDVRELRVIKTGRGEYLAVTTKEKGEFTIDVLRKALPPIIQSLQFSRMMRWGNGTMRFVRPICWILALFDNEHLDFAIDGLKSGNVSFGHRFLSPGPIHVNSPADYSTLMSENYVLADPDERKTVILDGIKKIESQYKCNATKDDELLQTVISLVEYPTVIIGNFDPEYLALPKKLPVTVMKSHQKYFSVEDNDGNLLPYFILISNTLPGNNEIVRKGAERVLKARLEDAKFYFSEDQKISLWNYVERLKNVTFHEKLGSLYEKSERVAFICSFIADQMALVSKDNLLRASMLSKADLVTGIVREFPELQGYMGMIYALNSGEESEVATGIYEHYLPVFSGDKLPQGDIGTIISLADKIDNISSFFLIGLIPTGSEDPFALRRQAAGILHILQNGDYTFSLDELIEKSLQGLESYSPSIRTLKGKISRFFLQRFEGLIMSQGYSHDVVKAALSVKDLRIRDICERVESLSLLKKTAGFPELLIAAKRVYNILTDTKPHVIKEDLFIEKVEKELLDAARDVGRRLKDTGYDALYGLEGPINSFFDTVLVMDKRPEIKENRLALLSLVKELFDELGDFSKIII